MLDLLVMLFLIAMIGVVVELCGPIQIFTSESVQYEPTEAILR